MFKSNYDENTEIENQRFRTQIQSIIKEARDTFSLMSNKEIISITKLPNAACSGGLSIIDWCGFEYTTLKRTDDDGKETVYIKINNFNDNEEE